MIWASLNCCRRITHASLDPEAGRPADSGQEVEQGQLLAPVGSGRHAHGAQAEKGDDGHDAEQGEGVAEAITIATTAAIAARSAANNV